LDCGNGEAAPSPGGRGRDVLCLGAGWRLLATAGDARGPADFRDRDRGLHLWELAPGKLSSAWNTLSERTAAPSLPTENCWPGGRGRPGGVVDLFTGREIQRFVGHRGRVTSVAFTGKARGWYPAAQTTTALVWTCQRAGRVV